MDSIHKLQHGQTAKFALDSGSFANDGKTVDVSYHRRQSQGDNGKNVPGAYTGSYTIQYPNGRSESIDHGPHATTEAASRRGANPNAKSWAAGKASEAVVRHLQSSRNFADRRV